MVLLLKEVEVPGPIFRLIPKRVQLAVEQPKSATASPGLSLSLKETISIVRPSDSILLTHTCLHFQGRILAIGCNVGLTYIYEMQSYQLVRLVCMARDVPISVVKVLETKKLVAVGQINGCFTIFQLTEDNMTKKLRVLSECSVSTHHTRPLTCLEWHPAGTKLFTADSEGHVAVSIIGMEEGQTHSIFVCKENTAVIQIGFSYHGLVISTMQRTVVWSLTDHQPLQVGQRGRKTPGNFGACLFPATEEDVLDQQQVVFLSRPGYRLWKSDLTGHVLETLLFKASLESSPPEIKVLLPGQELLLHQTRGNHRGSKQFGQLLTFADRYLVSWQHMSLWVLDPFTGTVVGYLSKVGEIVDVATHGFNIILLIRHHQKFLRIITLDTEERAVISAPIHNPNQLLLPTSISTFHQLPRPVSWDFFIGDVSHTVTGILEGVRSNIASRIVSMAASDDESSGFTSPTSSAASSPIVSISRTRSAKVDEAEDLIDFPIVSTPSSANPLPGGTRIISEEGLGVELSSGVDAPPPFSAQLHANCLRPVADSGDRQGLVDKVLAERLYEEADVSKSCPLGSAMDYLCSWTPQFGVPLSETTGQTMWPSWLDTEGNGDKKPGSSVLRVVNIPKSTDLCNTPEKTATWLIQPTAFQGGGPWHNSLGSTTRQSASWTRAARSPVTLPDKVELGGGRVMCSPGDHTELSGDLWLPSASCSGVSSKAGWYSLKVPEVGTLGGTQSCSGSTSLFSEGELQFEDESDCKSPTVTKCPDHIYSDQRWSTDKDGSMFRQMLSSSCEDSVLTPNPCLMITAHQGPAPSMGESVYQEYVMSSCETDVVSTIVTGSNPPQPFLVRRKVLLQPKHNQNSPDASHMHSSVIATGHSVSGSSIERSANLYTKDYQTDSDSYSIINVPFVLPDHPPTAPAGPGSSTEQSSLLFLLSDCWGSLPSPSGREVSHLRMSHELMWCVCSGDFVYVSKKGSEPCWDLVEGRAAKVYTSPSGGAVWCLFRNSYACCRVGICDESPQGRSWEPVERDIACLAVEESRVWAIKKDGELVLRQGLSPSSPWGVIRQTVCASSNLVDIVASGDVVITRDHRGQLYILRCGHAQADLGQMAPEWDAVPSPEATALLLDPRGILWLVDSVGSIWFTAVNMVSATLPEPWYQVMFGMSLTNFSEFTSVCSLFASKKPASVASCGGPEGLVVLDTEQRMYSCKSHVIGTGWIDCGPSGYPTQTAWRLVAAAPALHAEAGAALWALAAKNELLHFSPGRRAVKILPPHGAIVKHVSAHRDALWLLTSTNTIYFRTSISSTAPEGGSWTQVDTTNMGYHKLSHLCCGSGVLWAVDFGGNVWFRMTREDMSGRFTGSWVLVDGSPIDGVILTRLAVAAEARLVWACDDHNNIYVRRDVTSDFPIGTAWEVVPDLGAKDIALGDTAAWALSPTGEVFCRIGVHPRNPSGDYWRNIPGTFEHISVCGDAVFAVDFAGHLHRRSTKYVSCNSQNVNNVQVSVGHILDSSWEVL